MLPSQPANTSVIRIVQVMADRISSDSMTALSSSMPSTMSAELPKSYTPGDWEEEIRARWEQARAFHADPIKTQAEALTPFCIVIPPPNVTAALRWNVPKKSVYPNLVLMPLTDARATA